MYEAITDGIKVTVRPMFLEEQSEPVENHYVWAYHVTIENLGERTVQLVNRYWRITDAKGIVQEVRGPGVVGEQPVLEPGAAFEYTSGTPLTTPSGVMMGAYEMEGPDGTMFDVAVPAFSLDSPHEAARMN
ncbi:MAG: Co2+/Mg2+ efflux protein ApaG [Proteobacteria bacterium]|nr:Co2+/Mg2+ efflux protein ApaG [Pseudomonadota bacterium]